MTATALIVGLGQIGMGYDLNHDPQKYVSTHARAFQCHPGYQLVGGVDPDAERRRLFETHYQCPVYDDVASAMESLRPDVVAVATPTAVHAATCRRSAI